jgi:hypothetical protein
MRLLTHVALTWPLSNHAKPVMASQSWRVVHAKSFMPRIDEQSDHAGHSFSVGWRLPGRRELGGDLFARQSGRQFGRRKDSVAIRSNV